MDLFDVIKIPVLQTERLILRSYQESDLNAYYEMMADALFGTGSSNVTSRSMAEYRWYGGALGTAWSWSVGA